MVVEDSAQPDGMDPVHAHEAKWQIRVVALVVLGCLATAGYAIVETFWG